MNKTMVYTVLHYDPLFTCHVSGVKTYEVDIESHAAPPPGNNNNKPGQRSTTRDCCSLNIWGKPTLMLFILLTSS